MKATIYFSTSALITIAGMSLAWLLPDDLDATTGYLIGWIVAFIWACAIPPFAAWATR